MSNLENAARLALDTLERTEIRLTQGDFVLPAIDALRVALAEQQAENDRLQQQHRLLQYALTGVPPEQQAEPVVDAVLAEREACARLCESTTASWTQHLYNEGCMDCAKAIRGQSAASEPVAISDHGAMVIGWHALLNCDCENDQRGDAIEALVTALHRENKRQYGQQAEPVQAEPVQAELEKDWPQEWVGLTTKELYDCWPESNEPVAIARAIEAAYKKKNAQQAEPVQQIAEALRNHGLTLIKTASGYAVVKLGLVVAQQAKQAEPVLCANCSRDAESQAHAADIVDKWHAEKEQAEPVAWVPDWVWDYVEPQQAEPVVEPHKPATDADNGQSMTQADDSGNPSY
jgi:uncharacterized coiled-coil protein SlyX